MLPGGLTFAIENFPFSKIGESERNTLSPWISICPLVDIGESGRIAYCLIGPFFYNMNGLALGTEYLRIEGILARGDSSGNL